MKRPERAVINDKTFNIGETTAIFGDVTEAFIYQSDDPAYLNDKIYGCAFTRCELVFKFVGVDVISNNPAGCVALPANQFSIFAYWSANPFDETNF